MVDGCGGRQWFFLPSLLFLHFLLLPISVSVSPLQFLTVVVWLLTIVWVADGGVAVAVLLLSSASPLFFLSLSVFLFFFISSFFPSLLCFSFAASLLDLSSPIFIGKKIRERGLLLLLSHDAGLGWPGGRTA